MARQVDGPTLTLAEIISRYQGQKGALIPILLDVEEAYGYISADMAEQIAWTMRTSPAHVYAVASFYTRLRTQPRGTNLIRLCSGIACEVEDVTQIQRVIEEELGISVGETTPDDLFTLEMVPCIGVCGQSPAMEINDVPYGNLTPDKVRQILARYRQGET
ncbi:MAG: NAD(P)H-dependent oxidoreductase subunit E [Anaerolineae bacterium]|jgi:NADH-quinone oxidoreductase subunit E|nr:NAD(P)H-dependent oxidoreductase subunit E [Anaerolineae bacterium]MDH7475035.1 NAD(P)H-dependent oxidoreductase subunit E [Anaerolineae bacterium]